MAMAHCSCPRLVDVLDVHSFPWLRGFRLFLLLFFCSLFFIELGRTSWRSELFFDGARNERWCLFRLKLQANEWIRGGGGMRGISGLLCNRFFIVTLLHAYFVFKTVAVE